MDILVQLPEKKRGNLFVLVGTYRRTTRNRLKLASNTNATTIALIYFEDCEGSYGIFSKLPTDNGSQFVPRMLVAAYSSI